MAGIIIASISLFLGLLFILFPKLMAAIFRVGAGGQSGLAYHNFGTYKKKGKWRFGLMPSVKTYFGEKNAIVIFRFLGIMLIIISIFAYIYAPF